MRSMTDASGRWLRRYHQADTGAPVLVCFAHAGGSASYFHPVSARLSPALDVVAVQYPGRQDRRTEDPIDSIAGFADAVLPVLRPLADAPRMALFGHSMGAVIAYEVALRLAAAGAAPLERLFVSGRRAPSRVRAGTVHQRDDAGVLAELRTLGGTDTSLLDDPELQALVLPAVRADYRAVETYREVPGRMLDCPVTALIGDVDPQVTEEEARDWAGHTTGPFELRVFPGGHFYLQEQAGAVIDLIAARLRPSPLS
jgi:pyochelin biosynthesis protein PchC